MGIGHGQDRSMSVPEAPASARGSVLARWAWIPAGSIGIALTGVLAWTGLARPTWAISDIGTWSSLVPYPTSVMFPVLYLAVMIVAAQLFAHRRASRRASALPVLTLLLTAASIVLGITAYLPCTRGGSSVLSASTWTISLFLGNVESSAIGPSTGATCSGAVPMSLQLARFTAIGATFLGVLGAASRVVRDQVDRARGYAARSVDVIVGSSADAGDAATGWLRTPPTTSVSRRAKRRLVIVNDDHDDPLHAGMRAAGAIVFVDDPQSDSTWRGVALSGASKRPALHNALVLGEDDLKNMHVAETIGRAVHQVSHGGRSGERPGAPVVCISTVLEDRMDAEEWRLSHFGCGEVVHDAITRNELLARDIVETIYIRDADRIILLGSTPLAQEVLDELAWRRWMDPAHLNRTPRTVLVVGDDADGTIETWRRRAYPALDDLAPAAHVFTTSRSDGSVVRAPFTVDSSIGSPTRWAHLVRGPKTAVVALPDQSADVLEAVARIARSTRCLAFVPDDARSRVDFDWNQHALSTKRSIVRYGPGYTERGSAPRSTWSRVIGTEWVDEDDASALHTLLFSLARAVRCSDDWTWVTACYPDRPFVPPESCLASLLGGSANLEPHDTARARELLLRLHMHGIALSPSAGQAFRSTLYATATPVEDVAPEATTCDLSTARPGYFLLQTDDGDESLVSSSALERDWQREGSDSRQYHSRAIVSATRVATGETVTTTNGIQVATQPSWLVIDQDGQITLSGAGEFTSDYRPASLGH